MTKAIRGLVFGVLILAVSAALIMKGAGTFDTSPRVYVNVPAAVIVPGESEPRESGLLLGSNNTVRYEGVGVGQVTNVETGLIDADGAQYSRVELQVKKEVLDGIPTDALARIVPRTIFGDNEVHLVAPYEAEGASRSAETLVGGDSLALDTGPEARQLYDVYEKVMRAVFELNIEESIEGLRELRRGVEGRGEDLGNLIVQGADLLESINPLIEGQMIPDARRIAENLDLALPDMIATLNNGADLADLLVSQEDGLRDLFIAGAGVTRDIQGLLSGIGDDTIVIIDSGQIVAEALTTGQGTDALLASLRNVGNGIGDGLSSGRLKVNVLATFQQPLPYTSADCPVYDGLASNTCGPAGSAQRAQAPAPVRINDLIPGLAALLPPDVQNQANLQLDNPLAALEREIMRGIPGVTPASATVGQEPTIATQMLLGPLVRGTVVQVG